MPFYPRLLVVLMVLGLMHAAAAADSVSMWDEATIQRIVAEMRNCIPADLIAYMKLVVRKLAPIPLQQHQLLGYMLSDLAMRVQSHPTEAFCKSMSIVLCDATKAIGVGTDQCESVGIYEACEQVVQDDNPAYAKYYRDVLSDGTKCMRKALLNARMPAIVYYRDDHEAPYTP